MPILPKGLTTEREINQQSQKEADKLIDMACLPYTSQLYDQ